MLFQRPDDDILYDALLARDPSHDGFVFVAVVTTGVFCRLTCPARKPKRENVTFHDSAAACLKAGFRPCKRCRPMASMNPRDELVNRLLDELERDPERVWREADVIALGLEPSTVRRRFKRRFGLSFLQIAKLRRLGRAAGTLAAGGRVIDAQLDGGYASGGGFRDAITRLFGEAPANLRGGCFLSADWIDTPLGHMICIASDTQLYLLEFVDRVALPAEIRRLQAASRSMIALGRNDVTRQTAREIDAYFRGDRVTFDVELPAAGSGFQRQVWHALRQVPPGTTTTYGEIAARIGRPEAARAAARANGSNQIAIIIPCHRVLSANGDLTGYGGGLWRKKWLINHEARLVASKTMELRDGTEVKSDRFRGDA